jgi:hypothetical protein
LFYGPPSLAETRQHTREPYIFPTLALTSEHQAEDKAECEV